MQSFTTLIRSSIRPGKLSRGKSAAPVWHFNMLAGLILIVCLGTLPYAMPVQFIGVIAFFALICCHFMDKMFYQKNDQRLKAIFQASPNPIIVYDKQGFPQNINPAFTQVFGWTLNELRGKRIPFVPDGEIPITSQKIKEIFNTGRPVSFETKRMTKAGDTRDVIVSAAIAMGLDEAPLEMVVNITDITDAKRIEAQLRQSQKMEALGTLSGGIAHDFNNILCPLIGNAEMLQEDLDSDSRLQGYVADILTAGNRAKELVHQVLAVNRPSDTAPEALKLQPIIMEALKLLRSSLPTTIQIQQEIDDDCAFVIADPTQVHQVVMNLATNAFHAMETTGGTLSVSLKHMHLGTDQTRDQYTGLAPGSYARLVVADTGIGIEKQNMSKIFDPYFTTKDRYKGTGLGLSVVQGIVKSSGGDISVFSEPGNGSEFHVYWPSALVEKESIETAPPARIPGGTENILLVDDEQMVVGMECQVLKRLGYRVSAYTSSCEALAAFKDDPGNFDLVLSDMTMPEMTGDQLAQEIMAIRPSIPVIISTGYSRMLTPDVVKSIGIRGVLIKPASKSNLATTVRRVLDETCAFQSMNAA